MLPQRPRTARAERLSAASSAMGASLVGALWLQPTLAHGGLAPLVLAAGVAVVVGAAASLAEWRTPIDPDPAVAAAGSSLADLAGLCLASSALAWLADGSTVGAGFALLSWPIGALLARRPGWLALPALVALPALAGVAAVRAHEVPPWTLLQPEWGDWPRFVGPAVIGGLWLAGSGTGRWSHGSDRPPGAVRGPLAAAGLGIALATALAVDRAALFEASLGSVARDRWTDALLGVAAISLAGAAIWAPRAPAPRGLRPLLGLALTAGLWLGGDHLRPWVWAGLGPALTALSLASTAARASGADRTAAAVGALAAASALAMGWPGLPARLGDALLVGLALVAAFWLVATRSVLARRPL